MLFSGCPLDHCTTLSTLLFLESVHLLLLMHATADQGLHRWFGIALRPDAPSPPNYTCLGPALQCIALCIMLTVMVSEWPVTTSMVCYWKGKSHCSTWTYNGTRWSPQWYSSFRDTIPLCILVSIQQICCNQLEKLLLDRKRRSCSHNVGVHHR